MPASPTDKASSLIEDSIRIIRSTQILAATEIVLMLIGMLVTFLLARRLGVEGFGTLSFVLATVGLFNVLNDLGLSTLTIREVSQQKSRLGFNLAYVGSLEILLSVCTSLLVILIFNLFQYPIETKQAFTLVGVKAGFDGMSVYFRAVFRAFEKMVYDSLVTLSEAAFRAIGLIIVLSFSAELPPVAAAHLAASILAFFVGLGILVIKFERPSLKVSFRTWWSLLKQASPFMAFNAFNIVFNRADVTLVALFMGPAAAGLYSAAYRFYSGAVLLVRGFAQSVLPRFAEIAGADQRQHALRLMDASLRYLFALSLPFSVAIFVLADPIVTLVYGAEFVAAGLTLKILAIGIVPLFARSVWGSITIAFNKEKGQTLIFAACVVFNILLNLWLIRWYSHVGAAIANTAFLVVYTVALSIYVYTSLGPAKFWMGDSKTLAAGVGLAAALVLMHRLWPDGLIGPALVGGVIYLAALYGLGFFSSTEKAIMRRIFFRASAKD